MVLTFHYLVLTHLILVFLMKLTCFVLGYLVVRLGYELLVAGIRGKFKFKTEVSGFKADLRSVSPGLLFVLLGVLLIGYAIFVPKVGEFEVPAEAATTGLNAAGPPPVGPLPMPEPPAETEREALDER